VVTRDEQIAAALANVRTLAEDLAESIDGHDEDDPIGAVKHLGKALADALSVLRIVEGPDDELDEAELAKLAGDEDEDDVPPECPMCEGQGFGADGDGAVACPTCHGTGVAEEREILASVDGEDYGATD
jgi:hypothetical protein